MKRTFTSIFACVGSWSLLIIVKEENRLESCLTLFQSPSDFFKVEVLMFVEEQNWLS
jgi:hypothetical protein